MAASENNECQGYRHEWIRCRADSRFSRNISGKFETDIRQPEDDLGDAGGRNIYLPILLACANKSPIHNPSPADIFFTLPVKNTIAVTG
jgi:hypothetical protein